jgi:hypothetical protein
MNVDELIAGLRAIKERQDAAEAADNGYSDKEAEHQEADGLLLRFIANDQVTRAFGAINKWYA